VGAAATARLARRLRGRSQLTSGPWSTSANSPITISGYAPTERADTALSIDSDVLWRYGLIGTYGLDRPYSGMTLGAREPTSSTVIEAHNLTRHFIEACRSEQETGLTTILSTLWALEKDRRDEPRRPSQRLGSRRGACWVW